MIQNSTCQQLVTFYKDQIQLLKQANAHQNSLLHLPNVGLPEGFAQTLIELANQNAIFQQNFETSVKELLSLWNPDGSVLQHMYFENGRVHIAGFIDLTVDAYTAEYLPTLIKEIDGFLGLPPSINHVDYIEAVSGLYFGFGFHNELIETDFSAKRLKRATGADDARIELTRVNGVIDLPMLTYASVIGAKNATIFNAPKLETATTLYINGEAHLDSLSTIDTITVYEATKLKLPQVTELDYIEVYGGKHFEATGLRKVRETLSIQGLPKGRSFRDCFPKLDNVEREIYTNQEVIMNEVYELMEAKIIKAKDCIYRDYRYF